MTPQRVIRSFLLISGLYTLSASLIWGVNTLFLLDAGLDIMGVFIANAAFTAGMFVFEIPTGVLADTAGRRLSFLLSVAVLMFGTLVYVGVSAAGGDLLLFVIASIIMGLGFTFYSGAVEAWLVDALTTTGFEGDLDQVFARGAMVTGATMLVGTITGGVLGTVDLAIPFLGRALLLGIVFVIAYFTMHDIGFTRRALNLSTLPTEMRSVASTSLTYGWKARPVRLLMVVSLLLSGFMMWGFYAWQRYFLDLLGQPDAVWVAGVIAAAVSIAMILGNTIVEWFTRYCGKRTTFLLWATGIHAVAIIGVGLIQSFWVAVPLYLVAMAAMGVVMPVRQAYLHAEIPSEQRATVVSFDSMVGSAGGMISQSGLGYIGQNVSLASGYVIGGLFMLLALPALRLLRGLGGEADIIYGRGGQQGICAAQGLPSIAAVDATRRLAPEAGD